MNNDRHEYMEAAEIQEYLCSGKEPGTKVNLSSGEKRDFDTECYQKSGGRVWRWIVTILGG